MTFPNNFLSRKLKDEFFVYQGGYNNGYDN